jgi:acetyl esterase/lipase
VANARGLGSDRKRMAVAGHDAGGSLAAGLAAMACDQAEFRLRHRRCLRHCSIQT